MANAKISALTSATTPLAGTETLPIVQSSTTKQVSVANLTVGRTVGAATLLMNGTSATGVYSGEIGMPNSAGIRMRDGAGTSYYNVAYLDGSNVFQIASAGIATVFGGNITSLQATASTGNFNVSTAAKGLNLSANTPAAGMTSQLLNWYEEGTWTPTITFGTPGDLAITYSAVQLGTYTRIGNRVIINCNVSTTAFTFTTASGTLRVAGLPFTSRNLSQDASFGGMQWTGITKVGYTQVTPRVTNNVNFIDFIASGSAVSAGSVNATDTPSGGTVSLRGSITYEI